jgi:light-regulated signal transduction histidine kinase (bacteriophytochrome)
MRRRIVEELAAVERARVRLECQALELRRSNAELEQFAYVASHDLQEPLRKIASFCQALKTRYGDRLDERGEQYIDFAVDGAKRMQVLINDLLSFSRVGRGGREPEPVALAEVLAAAERRRAGVRRADLLDLPAPALARRLREQRHRARPVPQDRRVPGRAHVA